MLIIPAIDLIGGQCVRLTQGDYAQQTTYHTNPLAVAQAFEAAGLTRLHLVDLDGAKQKRVVNQAVLRQIAAHTRLHIDFGGGVQSTADLDLVLASGAAQVTGGSIAVKNPALFRQWLAQHGPERIVLGADVRDGHIAVSGWQENSGLELFGFLAEHVALGVRYVICTDVSRDGLLQGPAFALYAEILRQFPGLRLIASGGVSQLDDLRQLQTLGLYGAIVGKAIYENRIQLTDLKEFTQ
ncbi:MAG: 1-(5-phosphoribosyl)-5-[(5-phosphoribosylamino)methylideneamino]imidazole-4-carboxamide isomerase [Bernardetiaceae bacterium]|jgi:phosphoribosylformimino-5-aminoimidazole carboxamide ribotide isomerase|nr:1-(5-phosphoribosyl)-5-[(5-phosphoribosylamino)methylideneamino]imidazole-4-carboxamide isomerase [Bernardetiaceae bacterium]